MNLLKGNINLTNEMIDQSKTREELRANDILIDLLKSMKEQEAMLFGLIEQTENQDILDICLMVNEDMQTTFNRFRAIKEGNQAEKYVPGEATRFYQYLEPGHMY